MRPRTRSNPAFRSRPCAAGSTYPTGRWSKPWCPGCGGHAVGHPWWAGRPAGRRRAAGTDPEARSTSSPATSAARPFHAPDADRLRSIGLGPRELAAAVRAGALVKVADGIVLPPESVARAVEVLRGIPQPFTLSAARQALDTTRRVAVPLLELLDRRGATVRDADDRRTVARVPS